MSNKEIFSVGDLVYIKYDGSIPCCRGNFWHSVNCRTRHGIVRISDGESAIIQACGDYGEIINAELRWKICTNCAEVVGHFQTKTPRLGDLVYVIACGNCKSSYNGIAEIVEIDINRYSIMRRNRTSSSTACDKCVFGAVE